MYNPVATYRVQLHEKFTLAHLAQQLDYLQELGVTTIYASPTVAATPGSTHGYDGIDPQRINPEIGTQEELRQLSRDLRQRGMGWVQDIVPNHLAFHPANPWIADVLEKGLESVYAAYFDIPGTNELVSGTLMAPFLGKKLARCIEEGEVQVDWQQQRLVLNYYGSYFPIAPHTYGQVLLPQPEEQANEGPNNVPEPVRRWLRYTEGLYGPELTNPTDPARRNTHPEQAPGLTRQAHRWDEARQKLTTLMTTDEAVSRYVLARLQVVNQLPNSIHALCENQHYRLCNGDETRRRINFRRFFTVNGLICLAVERPDVFNHVHHLIGELVADGTFQGVRIDHVDGLFDPTAYLHQLRQYMGDDTYIIVEKILEPGEALPTNWPIQGSSGYDYLALVNNLLTDPTGQAPFTRFYAELVGNETPVHAQMLSRKAYILYHDMGGELANLFTFIQHQQLATQAEMAAINPTMLLLALAELLVQCPVYRYYGNQFPLPPTEADALRDLLNQVRNRAVELAAPADLLETIWLTRPATASAEYNARALRTYQRCMQFTGPLMAKGVEDTLLYTYFRFIGHNEVGDSAEAFGVEPGTFHRAMQERQVQWPLAMNGTSTHDTKRGEDARARLNVLTALGEAWTHTANRWLDLTDTFRTGDMPDRNDAYFILQTMVGAWPFAGQPHDDITQRLHEYITKALQEAKRHTNWTAPNKPYMDATHAYIDRLTDPNGAFWPDFEAFQACIADFAVLNSLAQVMLKCTTPGIPDIYQGCELYDFSLVDPDNRRPVNYAKRREQLAGTNQHPTTLTELWSTRFDGQIKLWLTQKLLTERRQNPAFWASAEYMPLPVSGALREHVLAFARTDGQRTYVVIVPLYLARLCREKGLSNVLEIDWLDTAVAFPAHTRQLNLISNTATYPVALNKRWADQLPLAFIRLE